MSVPSRAARNTDGLVVLALNSGSSSLKFGLYRASQDHTDLLMAGAVEAAGGSLRFSAQAPGEPSRPLEVLPSTQPSVFLARIVDLLRSNGLPSPQAIGHRIVHGGASLRSHCRIDASVLSHLAAATPFAPLHMPPSLALIEGAQRRFPGLAQIACFDTAFHFCLPEVARVLPIPKAMRDEGIERYGFHGLSCSSVIAQLKVPPPRRLVIAHLGNGASVTAVLEGRSIDTSMGLTPSGGVVMGSRCGDLDPGVLLFLLRNRRYGDEQLAALVDHQGGLLAISGLSSDMRELRRAAPNHAGARLAIEVFCYSVRKHIAAMIAALGGIDHLVFTGGIGEHDADSRAMICAGLVWCGVRLDLERNRAAHNPISAERATCTVQVLTAQEDAQIAQQAYTLLQGGA